MRLFFVLLTTLFISFTSFAQADSATAKTDTLAPYQKSPYIPPFRILMPDSAWFSNTKIQPKKPTLILYFSPTCGHCQMETEEIISKLKELNDLQIVMITSRPFEDMVTFADHYKLKRFPAIKIGTDPARTVTTFYNVKFTPFSAFYDRKGKLVKAYESGINMDELERLVK